MKILAMTMNNGSVQIVEAPAPHLGPGMIRVRTRYSAVSPGTEGNKIVTGKKSLLGKARSRPDQVKMVLDMARTIGIQDTLQKVRSKLDGAQPIGYSLAGEILEVGEGVSGFSVGDRVACAGGGYANHADEVVIPVNLAARLPEGVSCEAAAMTTIGAIALQGIRLANPTLGETAVVVGLGIVGQFAVQLLKANGCRVFGVDISQTAVDHARSASAADQVACSATDPVEAMIGDFSDGRGADIVLICAATASDEPVTMAGRICRKRGRVIVVGAVGMNIPREDYYTKEIGFSVSCSYGPGRYDPEYEEGGLDYPFGFVRWTEGRNMSAILDLIADGRIEPLKMVTHRFAFADAPQAYALISEKSEPFAGILLEYPESAAHSNDAIAIGGTSRHVSDAPGVGCIGAGSYAQAFLLPHFKSHQQARLTTISTRTGLSALDAGKRYGFAKAVDSAEAVIGDPDTQAVVIATRHDQHGPLTLQALTAGKHVFVEKPLCINTAELHSIARALRDMAPEQRPIVQTGFNRRFSASARKLKAHFGGHQGPLTMNYRINAGPIPQDHWIQNPIEGGGRIIGEVCHFIDLMQYVCGADPVEIHAVCPAAQGVAQLPQDNVLMQIRFADHSIASICYTAHSAKSMPKERLEVSGAGLTAVLDNFKAVEFFGGGKHRKASCSGKGQKEEVAAFLESLKSGVPAISLESQLATTLCTIKAVESLRSGLPEAVDIQALLSD